MERLPKAPAPLATANGIKPLIKAKEVIRIGRKRLVAPWMAAPIMLTPSLRHWFATSIIKIAFFPSKPINITNATCA